MSTRSVMGWLVAGALAGCSTSADDGPPGEPGATPGASVAYRMTSTLQPGQEIERCQLFQAPPGGLSVQRDEVRFTPGSHHVVLYKTAYTEIPTATERGVAIDATQPHDCNDGAFADWRITGIVAGSQSLDGDTFLGALPEGIALRVEPGAVLVMNTHYLNASPDPLTADAEIHLHTIPPEAVEVEAGMLFHYNPFIRVPANGASAARMRCAAPSDISITRLQSHMHSRGAGFEAFLDRGGGWDAGAEEIYTTTAWEQVPARDFAPPLAVRAGDVLDYRCDYVNQEARDVVQGLTTRDEMCVLIGSYYPRDARIEACLDDQGYPTEVYVGSGAATCAETLQCLAQARPLEEDGGSEMFGCVVESCPGAAEALSAALRCQMTQGRGACAADCEAGPEGCAACVQAACAEEAGACVAAGCD